jgi:hypothetical protein
MGRENGKAGEPHMTTVVNKRNHTPTDNDVYIGRGSNWGNPFIIGKHGNRADVILAYEDKLRKLLREEPGRKAALLELKGRTLICYCKPQACHGDILIELIEEMDDD